MGCLEAERQALAMVEAPDDAKVFDAGGTWKDRSFMAMGSRPGGETDSGGRIHRFPREDRLEAFIRICAGAAEEEGSAGRNAAR